MDILRLTLRQLQIFAAVARHGSTTAASVEIALSQSATSSAVKELERLLGMELFDRAGKRLLLNDNGRALQPRALALLDGAADIERLARFGPAQAALLRIGASTTIANHVLPRLLAGWFGDDGLASSSWQSRVMVGNTAEVCRALADFELDLGLIEGPNHLAELDAVPWVRDELVLVAAPTSAAVAAAHAAGDGRVPLPRLRDQVWLLRELGSGTREETDRWLLPALRTYRRSIELGSSEAIRQAAAAGVGVACLSAWVVADALAAGRLVRLATPLPAMHRQCHLVVHRQKQPTAALQAFVARAMRAADPAAA